MRICLCVEHFKALNVAPVIFIMGVWKISRHLMLLLLQTAVLLFRKVGEVPTL